jgi:molybdopterin converting factor small subunit
MLVKVKIYYFEVFGSGSITLELKNNATVTDVINELEYRFGQLFTEKTGKKLKEAFESYFNLFFNGVRIDLPADIDHKLNNNDELIIVRPVGGG